MLPWPPSTNAAGDKGLGRPPKLHAFRLDDHEVQAATLDYHPTPPVCGSKRWRGAAGPELTGPRCLHCLDHLGLASTADTSDTPSEAADRADTVDTGPSQ
ncbi:hypothetical protein LCGC14_0273000 [marine sediment metagenome]|uniref:Uncharacterized protein n=1 Tax=marine sediment metagenome TaxID=412755 RepID=A0A0F9U2W3_9ZZZZ